MDVAEWRKGVPAEALYWEQWLGTGGVAWSVDTPAAVAEFRARFNPSTPLDPRLRVLIQPQTEPVRILDIGAGPVTCLGTQWPGHLLEITPIDALAVTYNYMLELAGLTPPVRTLECCGEEICKMFPNDQFDMAYARNSLDHTYDPALIVRSMLEVVKPGGVVYLLHHIREADTQRRMGLHQWNFYQEGDGYVMREAGADREHVLVYQGRMTMATIGNDVEVVIRK